MANAPAGQGIAARARLAVLVAVVLVAACGKKSNEAATQAAARVNDAEITVHQINFRMKQERNLRPDQMDEVGRKVLEGLIDLELLVQKAEQLKIDKELPAQLAMDAARRDVLARSYVEQVSQSVPQPTDEAIRRYYDDNDALFAHRRVYSLQEVVAQVGAEQLAALRAKVAEGRTAAEVGAWLDAQNVPHKSQSVVRPAEQIPLVVLKDFARLPDGHGMVISEGAQVVSTFITSARDEPVTLERARPAITQYLLKEARRKALETNFQALRTTAKIEYLGRFAGMAASAPALSTTHDAEMKVQLPDAGGTRIALPASAAASGVTVSVPVAPASSVQVSLPVGASTPRVQVSLPSTPASGVRISLPGAASQGNASK